jgi:hypothetical protein
MDDASIVSALNQYVNTEDSTPVTQFSSYYLSSLRDSVLLHNHSQSELLVQAYIGRYFMRSGERLVVSLANKRVNRRELYPEIRHTLLEMMLVVSIATLAYILVRASALVPAAPAHRP